MAVSNFLFSQNYRNRCFTPEMIENISVNPRSFEDVCLRLSKSLGMSRCLDFRMDFAMYLLGPGSQPPPDRIRNELLFILQHHLPTWELQKSRLLDFVIAYGCGWKRNVLFSENPWDGLWNGALRTLVRLVESALEVVDSRLPTGGITLNPGNARQALAHYIALIFVNPEQKLDLVKGSSLRIISRKDLTELGKDIERVPMGGKLVLSVGGNGASIRIGGEYRPISDGSRVVIACCEDRTEIRPFPGKTIRLKNGRAAALNVGQNGTSFQIWQCSCGSPHCLERHRISSWVPAYSLRTFLNVAIKGVTAKGGKIQLGFFSLQEGMYYPMLIRGIEAVVGRQNKLLNVRARLVRAVVKKCSCKAEHFHMDAVCPKCGLPFDPSSMKLVESKAYFIIEGVDYEDSAKLSQFRTNYDRQEFCRCNNILNGEKCNNLVSFSFEELFNKLAVCQNKLCCKPLFPMQKLSSLLNSGLTRLAIIKKLNKMRTRLIERGGYCPHCNVPVKQVPWVCPYCGACNFGQNLVHLYKRTPNPYAS